MLRFELPQKYNVVFHFGHGHLFDAWSLLHLATGSIIGAGAILIGFNLTITLTAALVAMFTYELIEALIGIVENIENVIIDVLLGAGGIILTSKLIDHFGLEPKQIGWVLLGTVTISVGLLYLGWRSYLKRRLSKPTSHLFPSWDEPVSRRKIVTDLIIFGGTIVSVVPVPYLWLVYDFWSLAWPTGIILATIAGIKLSPIDLG